MKRDDFDWTQSRVIFVALFFTDYQKMAIGFKDLAIELWEVKKYSRNLVLFNQIQSAEKAESITKISRPNENVKVVSREIITILKIYTYKDVITTLKQFIMTLKPG